MKSTCFCTTGSYWDGEDGERKDRVDSGRRNAVQSKDMLEIISKKIGWRDQCQGYEQPYIPLWTSFSAVLLFRMAQPSFSSFILYHPSTHLAQCQLSSDVLGVLASNVEEAVKRNTRRNKMGRSRSGHHAQNSKLYITYPVPAADSSFMKRFLGCGLNGGGVSVRTCLRTRRRERAGGDFTLAMTV